MPRRVEEVVPEVEHLPDVRLGLEEAGEYERFVDAEGSGLPVGGERVWTPEPPHPRAGLSDPLHVRGFDIPHTTRCWPALRQSLGRTPSPHASTLCLLAAGADLRDAAERAARAYLDLEPVPELAVFRTRGGLTALTFSSGYRKERVARRLVRDAARVRRQGGAGGHDLRGDADRP